MKTGINHKIRQIWENGDNAHFSSRVIKWALFLFCLLYGAAVSLRNRFYDTGIFKQERLPCKVISIGNITVGGTGKTPLVIMLANFLREKGYTPAVISRGYGGKTTLPVNIVSDGFHILMGHVEAGDEPVLIAKSTEGVPVITGPKRTQTGRVAIEKMGADVLILDDGFQHRAIFRDVDIVLMNREKSFGNGYLLPRGPLREPAESMKRADLIIWRDNSFDGRYPLYQEQGIDKFLPVLSGHLRPISIIRGSTGESFPLEYINGKRICAFAGIGSPESFRDTIESIGGDQVSLLTFPDHYRYTAEDLINIREKASAAGADILITTEKDGIRLSDFPDFLKEIYMLRVAMEMLPSREAFASLILEKLR